VIRLKKDDCIDISGLGGDTYLFGQSFICLEIGSRIVNCDIDMLEYTCLDGALTLLVTSPRQQHKISSRYFKLKTLQSKVWFTSAIRGADMKDP
jgi:hypothetical protein